MIPEFEPGDIPEFDCRDCGQTFPITLEKGARRCVVCDDARRVEMQARIEEAEKEEKAKALREQEAKEKKAFDRREAAKRELARRELARRYYLPFVQMFNPEYEAGWVHKDVCRRLEKFSQEVADKKSPRLMLFMPPRHGKSQLTSKTFAAWHLGHYPGHEFMACSYSASLSMGFSRNVRSIIRDPQYQRMFETRLDPDSQSAEAWLTTDGGGFVAAGVGGAITGKGAHILLIDDPVKNREDADSETSRQTTKDWYTSTAYTRLAPGGGVIVIMTRWHDDDLAGWLLELQNKGEGDEWDVVVYPAIAEADEQFRNAGEALHPERYDLKRLSKIQRALGGPTGRDWVALYQQKPVADEGSYIKKDMIHYYRSAELPDPKTLKYYQAWDLAIGLKEYNDWSVGITVGMCPQRKLWLVDLRRFKKDSLGIVDEILNAHQKWNPEMVGIERGQIELAIGPLLERRIAERSQWSFSYEPLKPGKRDKPLRGRAMQGLMQQGMVLLPEDKSWTPGLVNELLRFPSAVHDDQVDALFWLGLMVNEMIIYIPPTERKKSWRDKLNLRSNGHRSAMSA